ncbi:MAG: VOC family protein [Acidimicrobiales bacterium]
MSKQRVGEFELGGVNHLALTCSDMARTVEFYTNTLGMPLVKALNLPGGRGQHFFFDCGNGDLLAFFWFPGAPAPQVGSTQPEGLPGPGSLTTAYGGMNHIAFDVPVERFDACVAKLAEKGIEAVVINHDDSERQVTKELHDGVWVRSVYFRDPDGILLEFACLTREFTEADVVEAPVDAAGNPVALTRA